MFRKYPKSKKYTIGEEDLAMDVYLPPQGQVPIGIAGQQNFRLEKRPIFKRSSSKKEQYWERPLPPEDIKEWIREEKIKRKRNPTYFHPQLAKYIDQEWDRRENGFWFYNKGVPTYINGLNYFFLVHWRLDNGYPKYRKTDMEWFYFMQMVEEDPFCYGMLELTKRRQGKSARAGCWMYEYISKTRDAYGGIQSKTDKDAIKNVFGKMIIAPFKKLPHFFRPTYDTSQGTTPKSELRFFEASRRGNVDYDYDMGDELESFIEPRSSDTFAFDGEKTHRKIHDEEGKPVKGGEIDVYDRWDVVKPCLEDDEGPIIGKCLSTTTFDDEENVEQGASIKKKKNKRGFKLLWRDSDQTKRDENGQTMTGLYRYFRPAYKARSYDVYGHADEESALKYFNNRRDALKKAGDITGLASFIRKYPNTWQEALRGMTRGCHFNEYLIDERYDELQWAGKETIERGRLEWEERDKKVKWVKDNGGNFVIDKRMLSREYVEGWNNVEWRGSRALPKNRVRFVLGVDPYDHDIVMDGRPSMGAGAVFSKYDHINPDNADNFVMIYLGRPPKAVMFYDDMLKACFFFGCQMLFEDNKIGIKGYFEDRGYQAFLMRIDKRKEGISGSRFNTVQIVEEIQAHVEDNVHKTLFVELLDDWKTFDMNNTTQNDLTMASGYALIGAHHLFRVHKALAQVNKPIKKSIIPKYKIRAKHLIAS
jgi:hypothetical protein